VPVLTAGAKYPRLEGQLSGRENVRECMICPGGMSRGEMSYSYRCCCCVVQTLKKCETELGEVSYRTRIYCRFDNAHFDNLYSP